MPEIGLTELACDCGGFDSLQSFGGLEAMHTKNTESKNIEQQKMTRKIRAAAVELLDNPKFLYRANITIGALGVAGEPLNRLVLFLAGLTRDFSNVVSILVQGLRSTGKNNVVKAVTRLFPPECILTRSSLTKKALAYGGDILKGKIFYLFQYDGGKDAQFLMRILQSEGTVEHEYTKATGRKFGTRIARRKGTPAIFTTTTDDDVYEDDKTRFLTIRSDDSPELTREVIRAVLNGGKHQCPVDPSEIAAWQEALRILGRNIPRFAYPPWFEFLAEHFPADDSRARRDVPRFLTLLEAVSHCLSYSDGRRKKSPSEITITFSDYCAAWKILNEAFAATYRGVAPEVLKVAEAVRHLHSALNRPISVKELAAHLGKKRAVVYKLRKKALSRRLLREEGDNQPQNKKPLLPGPLPSDGFLPAPEFVFEECPEVGDEIRYVDPITGEEWEMRRSDKNKVVHRKLKRKTDA